MRLTIDLNRRAHFCSSWTSRLLQMGTRFSTWRVLCTFPSQTHVEIPSRSALWPYCGVSKHCCVPLTAFVQTVHNICACVVYVSCALTGEVVGAEAQGAWKQQQVNAAVAAAAALQTQHHGCRIHKSPELYGFGTGVVLFVLGLVLGLDM